MNRNEGTIDRVIRVVLGLGLLSLTVFGPHTWLGLIGWTIVLLALVLLLFRRDEGRRYR